MDTPNSLVELRDWILGLTPEELEAFQKILWEEVQLEINREVVAAIYAQVKETK